jgi:hypothetical protein
METVKHTSGTVPSPIPLDDPDAWYASDVRDQREPHPGVVATIREIDDGFRYDVRTPALGSSDENALISSRVESGTVYGVLYNRSAARAWAAAHCSETRGPNRQFGACNASRGVVVQSRDGRTHVLAVAFDVRVTAERGWYETTFVVGIR